MCINDLIFVSIYPKSITELALKMCRWVYSIIQFWSELGKQCDDVTENQQLLGTRNKKQQQCAISKLKINCSNFSSIMSAWQGKKLTSKVITFCSGQSLIC